jgi:N-acetylglucosaminyldiphosphoundecaprenol N-acetyl-beta-D-mannosaminyltransferase
MYVGNCNQFANTLIETINNKQASNHLVSATSVHGIVYANKNLAFKNILNNFYCNLPDGMPLTWIGLLKGFKRMKRCTGLDTFKTVMYSSSKHPIKHFFCGGKDGVAYQLQNASSIQLGNSNVVGTYSPPFREMTQVEFSQLGSLINSSGANVVWIGLSTPKQEIFASELSKYINVNYIITVGAVFDFFTGNLQRAPKWIQNFGFEWLYRLCKEPRRLFKRYAEIVPMFIWLNLKSIFK